MKCVICGRTIGAKEPRGSIILCKGDTFVRHLYACPHCNKHDGPFDRLIDSLPTDDTGRPQAVRKSKLAALLIASNPKALAKRIADG